MLTSAVRGSLAGSKFAVFTYVKAHVALEERHVTVFNTDRVAVVDFGDVVIPQREIYNACFVSDECVADFVG